MRFFNKEQETSALIRLRDETCFPDLSQKNAAIYAETKKYPGGVRERLIFEARYVKIYGKERI